MSKYKLYFVAAIGHFMDREDIECADDETAIARAREIACGIETELWCGIRRVAVLKGLRLPGKLTPPQKSLANIR